MKRLLALVFATLLGACAGAPPRPVPAPAPATTALQPPAPPATPTPPRTDVLLARARALRADGDLRGARSRLEAALQGDPANPAVRVELADVLVAEGLELDRAASLLDGAAESPDAEVSLVRARLCEVRADDAGAASFYAAALARNGDNPEARLRRALALERLGRTAEQIVELERLRAERPGDAFVRAHLGDAYEDAGRRGEAESELRWVAEAQPDRAAGWLRLARFYERGNRPREAREAAERARAVAGARPERRMRPLLPSKS